MCVTNARRSAGMIEVKDLCKEFTYSKKGIGVRRMAFWMIDAQGAIFIVTLVGTIVSGGIFPLDIFSSRIQFLLHLLPFPYTSYFPVSVLCGTIGKTEIMEGFLLQAAWIVLCSIISKILWNVGTKRYVAIGG